MIAALRRRRRRCSAKVLIAKWSDSSGEDVKAVIVYRLSLMVAPEFFVGSGVVVFEDGRA